MSRNPIQRSGSLRQFVTIDATGTLLIRPTVRAARRLMTATPRGLCERYTERLYAEMRDDAQRTSAYEDALRHLAAGRVVLDLGTGGLALLAVMAARAGASRVYALESNAEACEAARRTVAELGLQQVIEVLEGYSTEQPALPEPPSLLVHEILGEVAGCEGAARCVADAHARLLAPGAVAVPASARSLCAPCSWPSGEYWASLPNPVLSPPPGAALKLPRFPREATLAPAQPFEQLDFGSATAGRLAEPQHSRISFGLARAASLRGLALHIEVAFPPLAEGAAPRVSSADEGSHWPTVLLPLPQPAEVAVGDTLVVEAEARSADEQPRYSFHVWLQRAGAPSQPEALGCLCYP